MRVLDLTRVFVRRAGSPPQIQAGGLVLVKVLLKCLRTEANLNLRTEFTEVFGQTDRNGEIMGGFVFVFQPHVSFLC